PPYRCVMTVPVPLVPARETTMLRNDPGPRRVRSVTRLIKTRGTHQRMGTLASNNKQSRQARAEQMRKERERADARRRNGITVAVVAIVVVLIVVAGFAVKNELDSGSDPGSTPSNLRNNVAIDYDTKAATGKPADGDPVTVTLYEDYQCPACKAFHQSSSQQLEKLVKQGTITIEYRPIAFLDRMSSTNYSSRALNAAACVVDAKGPKEFHAMHDLLFVNQPPEGGDGLTDEQL